MKVSLIFVPPGGGEADYQLEFELPGIPQKGDYIAIQRDPANDPGFETFIVRRTIWQLKYPPSEAVTAAPGEHGKVGTIWVECEFARSPLMTKAHAQTCEMYQARGKNVPDQEDTAF
jgi:hypothetical protein